MRRGSHKFALLSRILFISFSLLPRPYSTIPMAFNPLSPLHLLRVLITYSFRRSSQSVFSLLTLFSPSTSASTPLYLETIIDISFFFSSSHFLYGSFGFFQGVDAGLWATGYINSNFSCCPYSVDRLSSDQLLYQEPFSGTSYGISSRFTNGSLRVPTQVNTLVLTLRQGGKKCMDALDTHFFGIYACVSSDSITTLNDMAF